MKGRIWTVPNQITFLRLGFLPFFLIFMSYEKYKWALLILVIAGFAVVLCAAYPALHLALLIRLLVYSVSALCVISGVHYSFTVARRLNAPAPPEGTS